MLILGGGNVSVGTSPTSLGKKGPKLSRKGGGALRKPIN